MKKLPSRRDIHRARVAAKKPAAPTAKALPVRKRKQREHFKDANDYAVTMVGRKPRRVWLGGISAQRGY